MLLLPQQTVVEDKVSARTRLRTPDLLLVQVALLATPLRLLWVLQQWKLS